MNSADAGEETTTTNLLTPVYTVPLFNGQFTFDKEYNNRSSIDFVISSSVSNVENGGIASGKVKVLFSSVITGHGSDENGW